MSKSIAWKEWRIRVHLNRLALLVLLFQLNDQYLGLYESRMRCARPIWDNLDVESRGASTSTFKSDAAPFPPLPSVLLGMNMSDNFFSNFQSYIIQYKKHSC